MDRTLYTNHSGFQCYLYRNNKEGRHFMDTYNHCAKQLSDKLGGGQRHTMQLFRVDFDYEIYRSEYDRHNCLAWFPYGRNRTLLSLDAARYYTAS